jgi:hypothetical protein
MGTGTNLGGYGVTRTHSDLIAQKRATRVDSLTLYKRAT